MYCIFAILLFAGQNSHLNRLVVTGKDANPTYAVYTNHVPNQFPLDERHPQILMTRASIRRPGTYSRIYCSFTMNEAAIAGEVAYGLEYASLENHLEFADERSLVDQCFDSIQALLKPGSFQIHMTQISLQGKCTKRMIATLAYRGPSGFMQTT